jgi:site-specific recombinase XerD
MEKLIATTGFILDKRRKKAGDVYPVKLRVIYNRQNRLYGTIFDLSSDDFDKVMGKKPREDYKDTRKKLDKIEDKAIKIINELRGFSFSEFGYKFTGKTTDPQNVFHVFEEYIAQLEKEDRIGTANSYLCALNSLKKFHPKETLSFQEVTTAFLKNFETWSILKGNSQTTIGIYLRSLRTIYNIAIARKMADHDDYPFGRKKYELPAPRNIKKALSISELKKIFEFEPDNKTMKFHRDLWLFSYLCNGANLKDICLLKYSDIKGDSIIFRRAKTMITNRKSKPIIATYTDHIKLIIEEWGDKSMKPDAFIFPVLKNGESEKRIKEKVAMLVKQINKYIDDVAKACGIASRVTTYTARHSFATVLRRSGVSTSYIAEFLGHADEKTTESYLGSIEDPERKMIANYLTNFGIS